MKNRHLILVIIAAAAVCFASCGGKNVKKGGANDMVTDTAADPSLEVRESTDTEASLRSGEFVSQDNILAINFDYDSATLSDEARRTLQDNAAILKPRKDWTIMVEGHCDQRGTIEYNLALGQKRAQEVRDYYVRLGVSKNSLGTISYGKEKPVCEEDTDACWHKNRRAETKVRIK